MLFDVNVKIFPVPVKVLVITNILLFALLDMRREDKTFCGELQELLFERCRVLYVNKTVSTDGLHLCGE